MAASSVCGSFGLSSSQQSMSKSLTSISNIQNHANLICHGVIPNIATNEITTTVQALNPDPQDIMNAMGMIKNSSDNAILGGGPDFGQAAGKAGNQYLALSSDYVGSSVSALNEVSNANNQVIDTNSMMNAFTDFVSQCAKGECGVPINYFLKRLTKADIAKCYIRKFYQNGASDPESARKGMLGQE